MFAFEGDVAPYRLEERSHHESQSFRIMDRTAMSNVEQDLCQILCRTFVLDMLGLETANGSSARACVLPASSFENRKHMLLLVAVGFAQQRNELVGDL